MISYLRTYRFVTACWLVLLLCFAAGVAAAQTVEQALQPPSLTQTPTVINPRPQPSFRLQPPASSVAPNRQSLQFPASQMRVAPPEPAATWRPVPTPPKKSLGDMLSNFFLGQPKSGQSVLTAPPAAAQTKYLMTTPSAAQPTPLMRQPLPRPLQPVPARSVPVTVSATPTRIAKAPTELPFQHPRPNLRGSNVPPPTAPQLAKPETTTWGITTDQPPVTSGQDSFGGSSPGITYDQREQPRTMQSDTTHGCVADTDSDDRAELPEPIPVGSSAGSGGAGQAAQDEVFELNLNPPWVNRLFPNWEPIWQDTAVWRAFDGRRQKVSAGAEMCLPTIKRRRPARKVANAEIANEHGDRRTEMSVAGWPGALRPIHMETARLRVISRWGSITLPTVAY